MLTEGLIRLLHWLVREPAQPAPPSALNAALEHYQQSLEVSQGDPNTLLAALLARDQVEVTLTQTKTVTVEQVQQLVARDGQLRKRARPLPADLAQWRSIVHPPDAAWWWRLDQKAEEQEKENDLPWVLLTGTLLTLTVPLALEIIKRLWDGAPDGLSVLGTLLTLVITGSPLFKRGQELAQWVLQRARWIKPRYRTEAMTGMAALAFAIVLAGRLSLPQLAAYYNNMGHAQLHAGNLTAAQQSFQRAMALDPSRVVPYQNIADVYQRIGRPKDAMAWYQKAIERDLNFAAAYGDLGHLYNVQSEFAQAEQVLVAGLAAAKTSPDAVTRTVTRYRLLADLGWSYFGQKQMEQARQALEEALALEDELKALGDQRSVEYRLALPHYVLAQVYEQLNESDRARQQWEDSLRFLDQEDWADKQKIDAATSRLKALESK